MSRPVAVEAVTFDVTGTLLHCPRLGEIYAEVLSRHGLRVGAAEARRAVLRVWEEFSCSLRLGENRFASHAEGARGWWFAFLDRVCQHLGQPAPSPFARVELFERFARGDSWQVYPEVPEVLAALRARGLRLGVISNWDHRLPGLLEDLGLRPRLDVVVFSEEVGAEKPYPGIFRRALELLDAPPAAVVHVGDRRGEDVEGAWGVGMRALLLDRSGGVADLPDLRPLVALCEGAGPRPSPSV